MKKTVTISMEVDLDEYGASNDAEGALDLAEEMIIGDADFPDTLTLTCEGKTKVLKGLS